MAENYRVNVEGGSKISLVPSRGLNKRYSISDDSDGFYYSTPELAHIAEIPRLSYELKSTPNHWNLNHDNSYDDPSPRQSTTNNQVLQTIVEDNGDYDSDNVYYDAIDLNHNSQNSWKKNNKIQNFKKSKNSSNGCKKKTKLCCVNTAISSSENSSDGTDCDSKDVIDNKLGTKIPTKEEPKICATKKPTEFALLKVSPKSGKRKKTRKGKLEEFIILRMNDRKCGPKISYNRKL